MNKKKSSRRKSDTSFTTVIISVFCLLLIVVFIFLIWPLVFSDEVTTIPSTNSSTTTETEEELSSTDDDDEDTYGSDDDADDTTYDDDSYNDSEEATTDESDESSDVEADESSEVSEESSVIEADPYYETEGASFDDIMVQVLSAVLSRDFDTLGNYVGSSGLRLSPMGEAMDEDLVLDQDQVRSFFSLSTRSYGTYLGSGNAIECSPDEYYERFICPSDFDFGSSTVTFDADEDHEDAAWFSGTVHTVRYTYEPNIMEWQDIIMVYEETEDGVKLVEIIHRDVTTN